MEFDQAQQVFDEAAFLTMFFGALGGAVRAAVLRTTWIEALRVIFIGAATAFGAGVLSAVILQPLAGIPEDIGVSLGTRCSAAFLIGLLAVSYVERMIDRHKLDIGEKE